MHGIHIYAMHMQVVCHTFKYNWSHQWWRNNKCGKSNHFLAKSAREPFPLGLPLAWWGAWKGPRDMAVISSSTMLAEYPKQVSGSLKCAGNRVEREISRVKHLANTEYEVHIQALVGIQTYVSMNSRSLGLQTKSKGGSKQRFWGAEASSKCRKMQTLEGKIGGNHIHSQNVFFKKLQSGGKTRSDCYSMVGTFQCCLHSPQAAPHNISQEQGGR